MCRLGDEGGDAADADARQLRMLDDANTRGTGGGVVMLDSARSCGGEVTVVDDDVDDIEAAEALAAARTAPARGR